MVAEPESDWVVPEDIQPISATKTKTLIPGRKATKAKVLTISPYKNQLIESLRLGKTCGRGRGLRHSKGTGSGSGANRRQNNVTSSSSSQNDEVVESDSTEHENECPNCNNLKF